ncbi:MAG: glycerol-3-phosphate 1-O-acyltransferase PlsY [Phycisphaerales bacterium]|nr:glycerol-3-phosphate 1-O-acyltransferase PlsY [Phycisphaerales bacterium]
MTVDLPWIGAVAVAYIVGSIPFGLLVARARGIDIRQHGSKNIGATNVGRVLGKRWGQLVFALDALKGAAPVVGLGWWLGYLGAPEAGAGRAGQWLAVAIAAVLGHIFPVWLRFKGGKGVATGFGAMAGLWPVVTIPAFGALLAWLVTLRATRYVSVSSCVAAAALPVLVAVTRPGAPWPYLALTGGVAALVVFKHRANLARVRAGTEPKVGRVGGSGGAQQG